MRCVVHWKFIVHFAEMNSQMWLIIKSLSILVAHMRLLFILLCNSFDNSKHELSHIATWHLMLYLLKLDGRMESELWVRGAVLLLAVCDGFNLWFCYLAIEIFFFFWGGKNKIIFVSNFLKGRVIYFG